MNLSKCFHLLAGPALWCKFHHLHQFDKVHWASIHHTSYKCLPGLDLLVVEVLAGLDGSYWDLRETPVHWWRSSAWRWSNTPAPTVIQPVVAAGVTGWCWGSVGGQHHCSKSNCWTALAPIRLYSPQCTTQTHTYHTTQVLSLLFQIRVFKCFRRCMFICRFTTKRLH